MIIARNYLFLTRYFLDVIVEFLPLLSSSGSNRILILKTGSDTDKTKIQQTKMLVTCQRFGDWFLFGPVWPYSSNQKNIIKEGSKSLLLTCSSNKL